MADEKTTETRAEGSEPTTAGEKTTASTGGPDATPVATDTGTSGDESTTADEAAGVGAGPEGGPVPGDPSSEPVATAAQSWVEGRVGPPSIQQDSTATHHTGEGVETIDPGAPKPASTTVEGGRVKSAAPDPATFGAGPYGGDTPAEERPNVVHATVPGKGGATAEELPQGTPRASDTSAQGGPVTIPAATSRDSDESPASSSRSTSTSSQTDSAGTSEPAESTPKK